MNDILYSKEGREGKDSSNISGIFSPKEIKLNANEDKNSINNINKKLPFINELNKNTNGILRNNLHFMKRNTNRNKNLTSKNGFFSERLKNDENKQLKSFINKK